MEMNLKFWSIYPKSIETGCELGGVRYCRSDQAKGCKERDDRNQQRDVRRSLGIPWKKEQDEKARQRKRQGNREYIQRPPPARAKTKINRSDPARTQVA